MVSLTAEQIQHQHVTLHQMPVHSQVCELRQCEVSSAAVNEGLRAMWSEHGGGFSRLVVGLGRYTFHVPDLAGVLSNLPACQSTG